MDSQHHQALQQQQTQREHVHTEQHAQQFHPNHAQQIQQPYHHQPSADNGNAPPAPFDTDDIAGKAARAAQFAMQGFGMPNGHAPQQMGPHVQHPHPTQHPGYTQYPGFPPPGGQPPLPGQPSNVQPPQFQFQFQHHQPQMALPQPPPCYQIQYNPQMNGHLHPNMNQHQHLYENGNVIPYPTQTAPTQVLYERARQAATAKSSPSARRAGTPSQRRPWTAEEENALMAGLDRVKGPHWSQILAMFGPGGTMNESLKDRNQVQLKDKARNLKLFFLKSGIEVPYYLQFVTGELKTRAPAQAAKNEEDRTMTIGGPAPEDRGHAEAMANGATQNGPVVSDATNGHAPNIHGTAITSNDDQTPIPSIEEQPTQLHYNEAATAQRARRRDSTISADDNHNTVHGNTSELHAGYDLSRPFSNHHDTDAAAEAAAEAARAIALMGQGRPLPDEGHSGTVH